MSLKLTQLGCFSTFPLLLLLLLLLPKMTYATTTHTTPPFNLSSPPGTDIWSKPPSHNVFTAPTHPSPLQTYPLSSFQRAKLSFTLPPASSLRQYDQAGLVLHFTHLNAEKKDKWLKTGIEFYYGKPYLSTVGKDAWADWSVVPLVLSSSMSSKEEEDCNERPSATIEARREKDQLGKSLWVYHIVRDGEGKEVERRPLREVNWVFADEEDDGWSVGVGGYVCRPTTEGGEGLLEAEFGEGFEVEVLDLSRRV